MMDLAIYLHIPFCLRRCNYCSFVSNAGREHEIPSYIDALVSEIQHTGLENALVNSVYIGGGTPSLMEPAQVLRILSTIHENYVFGMSTEVTMEANPGTIDGAYLDGIHTAGINRLSLGIQSLNDGELRFLGRIHTGDDALFSIINAKRAGFDNISLDFIYGIPGRTGAEWKSMLEEMVALKVPHLSLYPLTVEEGTHLWGMNQLPDEDDTATEYELACDELGKAGYRHYEISNWAFPGFEGRHNLNYWKGGAYLGLGSGAHSYLNGIRRSNTGDLDRYIKSLDEGQLPEYEIDPIDRRTELTEAIILGLRLDCGISINDTNLHFGINLLDRFGAEISELKSLSLVEVSGGRLKLTHKGRLLGNEVFLRFLPAEQEEVSLK
jgi:oxygen-independent coproporphyrinogen-3 oxidase